MGLFLCPSHSHTPITKVPHLTHTLGHTHSPHSRHPHVLSHRQVFNTHSLKPSGIWFHTPLRHVTPLHTHTHLPHGWAVTPSHTSETHFALPKHMVQTQAVHPEQTLSGSEKQTPNKIHLESLQVSSAVCLRPR